MEWIRGGDWQVVPVNEPSATAYKACLMPGVARDDLVGRVNVANDAKRFAGGGLDRHRWLERIGEPAGLEVYKATLGQACDALDRLPGLEAVISRSRFPLEERPDRDELIADLIRFVTDFGPLGEVRGVVDLGFVPIFPDVLRGFDLDFMVDEVSNFAECFELVRGRPQGKVHQHVVEHLLQTSADDCRERRITPVFKGGVLKFETRPGTLRALLWQALIGRCERLVTVRCAYCDQAFDRSVGRGRPPKYCTKHRNSRFRHAAAATHEKERRHRDGR